MALAFTLANCDQSLSGHESGPASAPALPSGSQQQLQSKSLGSAQPEPRQIGSNMNIGQLGQQGSVFPYNMYQSAMLGGPGPGPQTPSASANSWLSLLRPSQGGRRSSLTSRLRNIMSAIFR